MSSPRISVIIPVMNDAEDLSKTLGALANQTYPSGLIEVIVVDNGSTDGSVDVAKAHPEVKVIREEEHPHSPYSARNRGIEISTGDVIAMLDSTCIPDPGWAEEAVRALDESESEMVSGDVLYWFPNGGRSAEVVDSLTNVRVERSIRTRNVAPTANLVVLRDVFDRVGMFAEGVRSGEDVGWTGRAVQAGFKLSFAPRAVVRKRARGLRGLTNKAWRVSRGSARLRAETGTGRSLRLSRLWELVVPRDTKSVFEDVRAGRENGEYRGVSLPSVYCVLLWLSWVRALGAVYHTLIRKPSA